MVYVFLLLGTFLFSAQRQAEWEDVIDKGADEKLFGMEINKGNLYLAGGDLGEDSSFIVLKLDSSGSEKLYKLYWESNDRYEVGEDIAVFPTGNIVSTGWYDALLTSGWYMLWTDSLGSRLFNDSTPRDDNGWWYRATSVVASKGDTCFIGGWFGREDRQGIRVAKYDPKGQVVWRHFVYGNDYDRKLKLTLDFSGSVYALSETRCNTSGFQNEYLQDSAQGSAIRINPANHVFIAGDVDGEGRDFMLLKYKTNGSKIWSAHKAYDLGADEECTDMALDEISDCYLAGYSVSGVNENTALVKTDSAGNLLWSWVDTVSSKREIEAIEVDNLGYIYLAGSAHNGTDWDMLVMKVRQPISIEGRFWLTGGYNALPDDAKFIVTGDTNVQIPMVLDDSFHYKIELYNGGNYIVVPYIPLYDISPKEPDQGTGFYYPLTHRMINQDWVGIYNGVGESEAKLGLGLEVNRGEVRFTLPESSPVKLDIFDVTGRKIEVLADGVYPKGSYAISLPSLNPGVYFARLKATDVTFTRKVLIAR